MNLAQLIPPEWAQDGCQPRHELARLGEDLCKGAREALPIRLGRMARDICAVLAQHPDDWFTGREVAERAERTQSATSASLIDLHARGAVDRQEGGRVRWRINQVGLNSLRPLA